MSMVQGCIVIFAAALVGAAARAETVDGGAGGGRCAADAGVDGGCPEAGAEDANLMRQLEKALQRDTSGTRGAGNASGSNSAGQPIAPSDATGQNLAPASPTALARGAQSLNPDLSVIIDANAGYERRTPSFRNSLDPILRSSGQSPAFGPAVQEVEVAASAIVDPYFKGELYLSIPNLNALEVEEGFVTTTSMPWNLQLKAGTFRSAFGRQNGQHTHVQDFTQRPLFYTAFLGEDGFRGPGVQVSWLAPTPFFLTLFGEVFDLRRPDTGSPVASFGGGSGTDLSYATEAKIFAPLSEDWSLYGGLSAATGMSPAPDPIVGLDGSASFTRRSVLLAADAYVKWKPPNVAESYASLAWQSEIVFRRLTAPRDCSAGAESVCSAIAPAWDGGMYSQLVYQLTRRWFLGVRGDLLGMPTSLSVPRVVRGSASLTFSFSEFARVRLHGELEHVGQVDTFGAVPLSLIPEEVVGANPRLSAAAYLQLEVSMGAHGAHPF